MIIIINNENMKKILQVLIVLAMIGLSAIAQTNVSGFINANNAARELLGMNKKK